MAVLQVAVLHALVVQLLTMHVVSNHPVTACGYSLALVDHAAQLASLGVWVELLCESL